MEKFEKQVRDSAVQTCLISRKGETVFEYFSNDKLETDKVKINSITKSILSILVGVAVDKRLLRLEQPIVSFFEEKIANINNKKKVTIRHLLTMTSGIEWNGNTGMRASENWLKYVLEQPTRNKTEEKMHYNCGNSHLLSIILQKVTGMKTDKFAEEFLFEPLGIKNYMWEEDPQGNPIGAFGLWLNSNDLLKIGQLCLQKGRWNGNEIVSSEWLEKSVAPHVNTPLGSQMYGYHWWVSIPINRKDPSFYYAAGSGGQYIFILPDEDVVGVFTSDFTKRDGVKPFRYFTQYIKQSTNK